MFRRVRHWGLSPCLAPGLAPASCPLRSQGLSPGLSPGSSLRLSPVFARLRAVFCNEIVSVLITEFVIGLPRFVFALATGLWLPGAPPTLVAILYYRACCSRHAAAFITGFLIGYIFGLVTGASHPDCHRARRLGWLVCSCLFVKLRFSPGSLRVVLFTGCAITGFVCRSAISLISRFVSGVVTGVFAFLKPGRSSVSLQGYWLFLCRRFRRRVRRRVRHRVPFQF